MKKQKCPYCAEEISAEAIKCKHCGEWLHSATENESQTTEMPIYTLSEDEKWDLKQLLKRLCEVAIVLTIIIFFQDILINSGGKADFVGRGASLRNSIVNDVHPSIFIIIAELLNVWIFVSLKKYFASLNSLFTQFIILNLVVLPFCAFDELTNNDALSIIFFFLFIAWIVYHIIIGVKIIKKHKDNLYLGIMFLLLPIVSILTSVLYELNGISYIIQITADMICFLLFYGAIRDSIKMEKPISYEEIEE